MTVYGQPVISRETRRLLITIALSVTALWVLARVRFQERPAASTPVPNVLAQLRPASDFTDLARTIADIRPGISAAMSVSAGGGAALRISPDAAVTLAPGRDVPLALDRATGLAIVQREQGDMTGLMPWAPRLLDYPRYLVAADAAGDHVALRPVYIGGLFPLASPLWPGELWALPPMTPITPGTFVFTTDGALAGLAVTATTNDGRTALVPPTVLFSAVERLRQASGQPGDLGVAIQPLSAAVASATGAATGVVIRAVDPAGAAAGQLVPTEIIEAVDGHQVFTPDHWRARAARVHAGETVTLRVRNGADVRDVQLTAVPPATAAEAVGTASLGLRLRSIPKVGVEVLSVQSGSRAAEASIQEGDIITAAAGQSAPTAAQLMRAFSSLPDGGSLVVAVTRAGDHHVTAIETRSASTETRPASTDK